MFVETTQELPLYWDLTMPSEKDYDKTAAPFMAAYNEKPTIDMGLLDDILPPVEDSEAFANEIERLAQWDDGLIATQDMMTDAPSRVSADSECDPLEMLKGLEFSWNDNASQDNSVLRQTTNNDQDFYNDNDNTIEIQPTPINESLPLMIVQEVSFISKSLIEEREALAGMLKNLQTQPSTVSVPPSPKSTSSDNSDSSCDSSCCTSDASETDCQPTASVAQGFDSWRDEFDPWKCRFRELIAYKKEYGHCNVPYHWAPNVGLSQWVKRQRHQHKLKAQGKHSNLTDEREALLVDIDFVWDSRASNWDNRFEDLKAFYRKYGHVQVSTKEPHCRALGVWLKRQRHNARKLRMGQTVKGGMTEDQVQQLLNIGVNLNVHLARCA